jgi:hypothetical protein
VIGDVAVDQLEDGVDAQCLGDVARIVVTGYPYLVESTAPTIRSSSKQLMKRQLP